MMNSSNDTATEPLSPKRGSMKRHRHDIITSNSSPELSNASSVRFDLALYGQHSNSGDIRHSSDSELYGHAKKRSSYGRSRSVDGSSLCIAQRAGAGGIRAIISNIELKSLKVDEESPSATTNDDNDSSKFKEEEEDDDYDPPTAECDALSRWSSDPYYRVVISTSGGISAVLQAMRAYPRSVALQVAACSVLMNLSNGGESTQRMICSEGGRDALLDAARNHPDCVAIQGAVKNTLVRIG